jgi:rsbT co-antagonist protein RsbR
VLPLIGTVDTRRAQDALEKALTSMAEQQMRVLIVDITGVITVDTMVADHLLQMAAAVRLMGGETILTGISPEVARTIVHLGVDLSALKTRATLAQGLALAIKLIKAH